MLDLVSPWSTSYTVSMPWAASLAGDPANHNPLNPDDARFYEGGEWLEDNGAGALRRGNAAFAGPNYQIFGERGRTDLPAMAGAGRGTAGKVTIIRLDQYEGITDMADYTGGGNDISALIPGAPLSIASTTIATVVRRALASQAVAGGFIQARVVSHDLVNNRVRFMVRS